MNILEFMSCYAENCSYHASHDNYNQLAQATLADEEIGKCEVIMYEIQDLSHLISTAAE